MLVIVTAELPLPGVTVSGTLDVRPSLVAVICVVPALTPVATPLLAPIVATVVDDEDHATVRPVSTVLSAARSTALSCTVDPTSTEGDAGSIVIEATGGGVTVTVVDALRPSMLAVICAVPADRPVTRPVVAATSAIAVAFDDQAAVFPLIAWPDSSSAVACSWTFAPTATLGVCGVMRTDATSGVRGPEESPQALRIATSASTDVA